jgi:putative ubiquitin-RnfH superfamily antitoxin RatB of RatAB toxin-antitoxin module|tara:strand:+ start:346 stop:591 length:246 start_codon:yes stop_codon:yes gene_type:complete
MEKVTEFHLMQALRDCSFYLKVSPTKEESQAIDRTVREMMFNWLKQQGLSDHERIELFQKLVLDPGPVRTAARKALRSRYH